MLEQELREPKMYFAVLQALSSGNKDLNEISRTAHADGGTVSKYLTSLKAMKIADG